MSHPHVGPQRLLHLLHLVSPTVPTGAFTYSQGIEWAAEQGWIRTATDLTAWLENQLRSSLMPVDIPLLHRLHQALAQADANAVQTWITYLKASRETEELLLEETQRGRALADWLIALEIPEARIWKPWLSQSQLAGFAYAALRMQIPLPEAALGYAWSWLENLVIAAVKIIPLGQAQGQNALYRLLPIVPDAVTQGLELPDMAIGASTPALAIASSCHEVQYTRLFRS